MLSSNVLRCGLLLSIVSWSFFLTVPNGQAQTPFTMSVYPDRVVLGTKSGFTDRFTVTVMAGEGFNGTVFLSVSGVPDNVTAVFRDAGSHLMPLAIFATYLEVTSSPNARQGNYTLTVSAASQGPSVFHAVAALVTLIIQETGQPRASLEGNRTQVTTPSAAGQEYVIPLNILSLATGIALGSVTTYIFIREKTRTPKRRKRPRARP